MPSTSHPVGIFILGDVPPGNIVELSRKVEACGFSELWFAEDYFMLSGFSSAAMALQATDSIQVGVGAVSAVVRHPAVTAMEAATLAGAFPGRFTLGMGHGVPAWTRQMKLYPKSVLTAMRESVSAVKSLLAGETLNGEGEYFGFDEVTLTHPAPSLQVLTAVVGPKSVDLTAEIADGMMISALGGPEYVRTVSERIKKQRPDGANDFRFVTYALTSVAHRREQARAKVRAATAFYIDAMGQTLLTGAYGLNDQVAALIAEGGAAAVEEKMPDQWIDWLAIAGDPAECLSGIQNQFAAGSTSVVLCVVPSEELPAQLDIISREILPKL
ncbi:MAG: LLM class flavin-dependent oxidoreductase [Rhodospirillaceae bacterium]|nr:LLM class flavin-dependent oxidoreductase [Rhodospirillaceae bacterium]MBT4426275.1 LLM class flavin-dependent oxidoreductase [Rhodospirillaceae bacterium]MBT5675136.1 LLM class flavin-dependent oxidoreductase [Rhodospirillaceae bacterium]MBT5780789.1 LLM class flavin-dependent oxidoreductase [Rhodospirillaceae bacterium]MBT6830481.1 LLM class flavin-dependent oxidoreductase [Rhodospirillaceae bacterium]